VIQLGGKFLRRRFFVGALVGGVLLPGGFILRAVEVVDSEATNDDEVMLMQAAVSPEEKEADGEMMMLPVAADDETNGVAVLQSAVRESNGKLTAQLRAAYVNWARDTVLTNLAVAGQGVPKDCLAEVMADATLRDAMFAAVYPPDPSILQNYARLRSELGANFLKKYQSLVIGVAVAMRVNGLLDVPRPVPPKQAARAANAERREAAEAPLVTAIAAFMKSNSVPALDLDQDAARREALAHALAGQGFTDPQLAAVTDAGRLFGLLSRR